MRIPPRLALSFLILFSLGISEARAQMPCPKETLTQGKCKIESLKVEERTIRQVLNTIAYEYGVPIGLEVAVSDDIARTISFSATNSSLTEVLDLIAQKDPSYTWEYRDGVINFYPKSEFRDTILFNLLETRIKTFNVRKRLSRLELRKSLTEIPEIKNFADSNGLVFDISAIHISQFRPFDQDQSFKVNERTVREIMNRIIAGGETKYWVVTRYGEGRKLLTFGL